ncbi:MAG: phage portal protein, partial [Gemmatimonadetes bacterium]|nr:phage portal protein [Gemmatimonadota bacterium]
VMVSGTPVPGLEPNTKYVAVKIPSGADGPTGRGLVVHSGEVYLPPGKYIHIPGLSFDGLAGVNLASAAKQTLGLSLGLTEFIGKFFSHGAKAATIIQPKEGVNLGPDARANIVRNLSQEVGGLSGAHRIAAVEAGIDIHTIGVSPQAAEFMALTLGTKKDVASYLDIPPYRMGADETGQAYNSIVAKQLDLLTWTHLPMLIRAGQVYTHELMPDRAQPLQSRTYYATFNYNAQLRAEPKIRAETDRLRLQAGIATINEIREEHDMNPIESDEADMVFVELNRIPLDMASSLATGGDNGSDEGRAVGSVEIRAIERRSALATLRQRFQAAQLPAFTRMIGRAVARDIAQARRAFTKAFSRSNPVTELLAEIEALYLRSDDGDTPGDAFHAAFVRELLPLLHGFAEVLAGAMTDELGREVKVTPEVRAWAEEQAAAIAGLYMRSSEGQLRGIVEGFDGEDADELRVALDARLSKWEDSRAGSWASNASVRAGGGLSVELYAAAGVTTLVWVGGDCDLCSSLNGTVVAVRQNFLNAGDTLSPEGASPLTVDRGISHPPLHPPSCDCVILAA